MNKLGWGVAWLPSPQVAPPPALPSAPPIQFEVPFLQNSKNAFLTVTRLSVMAFLPYFI